MVKVAIVCENGLEECEALIAYDLFKRAGYDVKLISANQDLIIKSKHNLKFYCDQTLKDLELEDLDCLYLPGGPAVESLIENQKLLKIIVDANNKNILIAAICAAPNILAKLKLVNNYEFSCFPTCDTYATANDEDINIKNNIFTAKALGKTFDFTLKIIENLSGLDSALKVKNSIYY